MGLPRLRELNEPKLVGAIFLLRHRTFQMQDDLDSIWKKR